MSTTSTASTASSLASPPPGALSTASTTTLPMFDTVFPSPPPQSSWFSFARFRIGPPPLPDTQLLQRMSAIAAAPDLPTRDEYAAAIANVRTFATSLKLSVAHRSNDHTATDAAVPPAVGEMMEAMHATTVASARFMQRVARPRTPPEVMEARPSGDYEMALQGFRESLEAMFCYYNDFLTHTGLPEPVASAQDSVEDAIADAAGTMGLDVVIILGREFAQQLRDLSQELGHLHTAFKAERARDNAVKLRGLMADRRRMLKAKLYDEEERDWKQLARSRELETVDLASLAHAALARLADGLEDVIRHHTRTGKDSFLAHMLLLRVHLTMFDLSVAISSKVVGPIARDQSDSTLSPVAPHGELDKYGDWGDTTRRDLAECMVFMADVMDQFGVGVLVGEQGGDEDAMDTDEDSDAALRDSSEGTNSDSDEEEGVTRLRNTPLARLFTSMDRFNDVMAQVWTALSPTLKASLQPETFLAAQQGDAWPALGRELCARMSHAELAEFKEFGLDDETHKRWRREMREIQHLKREPSLPICDRDMSMPTAPAETPAEDEADACTDADVSMRSLSYSSKRHATVADDTDADRGAKRRKSFHK